MAIQGLKGFECHLHAALQSNKGQCTWAFAATLLGSGKAGKDEQPVELQEDPG